MDDIALVLGATGKIGRRLAHILNSRGIEARRASRKEQAHHVAFDWQREDTWAPAIRGASSLFLVPPELVEDPSEQVATLLDLGRKLGLRKVVAVSSLGVTFATEPPSSGRHKIEEAVRRSGLDWTILQPGGFSQNFTEGFFAPGVAQGDVRTATGDGKVAMIDAGDIAAVAAVTLKDARHDGGTYRLTGPHPISFAEATAQISRVSGRHITFNALSEQTFRSMLAGFGLPDDYANVIVRDQIAIRNGLGGEVTDAVEHVTGRPATSFANFAESAFRAAA